MSQMLADAPILFANDFAHAVIAGLNSPQKTIPARYFYDRRGSELFEKITHLPEYYPTRTEMALLRDHCDDIARLTGINRTLVEFGSGSSAKTPVMLRAIRAPVYVPIDISGEFLTASAQGLAAAHPDVRILPIVRDFTQPMALPDDVSGPFTGFFPGSTIGNFTHGAAVDLLRAFRATLGQDARLVIGIDTRKNQRLLETAYDDAAGVTAQFNLNLLHRINRELEGTIPVDGFEHRAIWHDGLGRMEMHLQATRNLHFRAAGRDFTMHREETIHTENSYKYSLEETRLLARAAGWEPMASWTDSDGLFSIHVWATASGVLQP